MNIAAMRFYTKTHCSKNHKEDISCCLPSNHNKKISNYSLSLVFISDRYVSNYMMLYMQLLSRRTSGRQRRVVDVVKENIKGRCDRRGCSS